MNNMTSNDLPLVAPFVGERYAAAEHLTALLSPPYDVIAAPERAALAGRHRHNIVHLILPEGDDDRYRVAAKRLHEWRRAGVLVTDQAPAVHVVQQAFKIGGREFVRTGLIAAVVAEPFEMGRIKPHERTHAGPKQDRLALMRSTRTMFEALLMLTRDSTNELAPLLADTTRSDDPWAEATVGDATVRAWRVDGPRGEALVMAAGRHPLYIADGHHRFETAVAFRREFPQAARTLALIVSVRDPGLVVLPTHRVIRGGSLTADILPRLEATGAVQVLSADSLDYGAAGAQVVAAGGGCIMVLPGGRCYALARRREAPAGPLAAFHPAVRELDVTWADAYVLAALRDAAEAAKIEYSSDASAVVNEVTQGRALAGILLNPPAVEHVLAVADAGGFMPQKSTYFLPKVPSGLVMLPYERR